MWFIRLVLNPKKFLPKMPKKPKLPKEALLFPELPEEKDLRQKPKRSASAKDQKIIEV